jgi:hypothetical protein
MPPREIQRHLEDSAGENSELKRIKDRLPSVRTIERIRVEWKPKTQEEKAPYRSFYWPESMERGDLPWEASESALELLGLFDKKRGGLRVRPPVRFVKWFWRVSQAAPGAGSAGRVMAAVVLASNEVSETPISLRAVEGYIAYRPWEGEDQKQLYLAATSRAESPIPLMGDSVEFSGKGNDPKLRDWVKFLFGLDIDIDIESYGTFLWSINRDEKIGAVTAKTMPIIEEFDLEKRGKESDG